MCGVFILEYTKKYAEFVEQMYRKLRAVREYLFYLRDRYGRPRLRVGVVSSGVVPWRSWREMGRERRVGYVYAGLRHSPPISQAPNPFAAIQQ